VSRPTVLTINLFYSLLLNRSEQTSQDFGSVVLVNLVGQWKSGLYSFKVECGSHSFKAECGSHSFKAECGLHSLRRNADCIALRRNADCIV
jgi:hypothetical protein